ncbi:MAG: hypothetical protein ABI167_09375 [Nitrosospira sp.]
MALKRRWAQWPSRIAEELNGVSGVAGVGGGIMGIGSWTLLGGNMALMLAATGTVITIGAFGYAIFKAVPPLMKRPEDLVGRNVSLDELKDIFPRITSLAIIGPTQAGKTTLKHRLSFDVAPPTRTQQASAYVTSLQTTPPRYIAILDGGGERYPQQFKLAEICEYLCIVIDHNISDTDAAVDESRLHDHEAFLKQIRHHLDESNAPTKQWIHFLANKHDLWKCAAPQQRMNFDRFCKNEIEKWKQGRFAKTVDIYEHSNDTPNDIARFMALLKNPA